MNPNQQNSFQPYSPQYRNTPFTNYQLPSPSNQPHQTGNTLNLPKTYPYQPPSLSPIENNSLNKNKIDRAMYSSNIEGSLPNKNFTFGKLQSMGRFVPANDQLSHQNNKASFESSFSNPQNRELKFQEQRRGQFEPAQNISNKINQFDRFPSFNLQDNQGTSTLSNGQNTSSGNQGGQQPFVRKNSNEAITPQQKRRRQIMAIKLQLQMINKKMESSSLNKKYLQQTQIQKNDSKQPNSELSVSPNITLNNQSLGNYSHNPKNTNLATYSTLSSYNQDSASNGSGYSFRNNQLGLPERAKGIVAQSMIVSSQPSPGYKSIFEKYQSLNKPTYQTSKAEIKQSEDNLTMLDKFVNKGPGSLAPKQQQYQPFKYLNTTSNTSNEINRNSVNEIKTPTKNTEASNSNNFTSNYTFSNISYLNPTIQATSTATISQSPNSGAMFKKKKANFAQDSTAQFSELISPHQSKPQQQDIFNKMMKQMKIQQCVQFKKSDFIIGKKLGKGQFGEVMLVQHKKTGFLCGMKVMEKKQIRDEKYEGQIARELSIQFYLAHRNIAPLYGYFQDQKNVYLLVEYCTGGQLLQLLRKNRRMEEPEVSRIIRQIIEGIDYIHKELIIHRDIKPENILFNFGVAKICDFGWAVYKGHGMRKTASVGSPLYYSPEIVMGVEYDEKIDIWDIGMMTYECLLGKIPFRIYSQLDLNRIVEDEIKFPEYIDTSDEAKDFILRIMKKKPEERMEIREMLRHPFITKYQDPKLAIEIMRDFKEVISN